MGPTVLLVDADPRSLTRLKRIVEGTGATTLVATDPFEAMRAFVHDAPDLTLVQDDVAGDRGLELCRDMKMLRAGRGRRVVVVTGRRAGFRKAAREAGCDAFVEKPFEDRAIRRTARRFLAGAQA